MLDKSRQCYSASFSSCFVSFLFILLFENLAWVAQNAITNSHISSVNHWWQTECTQPHTRRNMHTFEKGIHHPFSNATSCYFPLIAHIVPCIFLIVNQPDSFKLGFLTEITLMIFASVIIFHNEHMCKKETTKERTSCDNPPSPPLLNNCSKIHSTVKSHHSLLKVSAVLALVCFSNMQNSMSCT